MDTLQEKSSKKGSFYCSVFGHNYQLSKKITYHVKEYKCCRCQKEMTTYGNGYLTELTDKFREINLVLERIHQNKLKRFARNKNVLSQI